MIFLYLFFFPPATRDTFTVNFLCDQSSYPGSLKVVQEDMSTSGSHVTHDALFEFSTALACEPAPVYCKTTGTNPDSHHPSLQTTFASVKLKILIFFRISSQFIAMNRKKHDFFSRQKSIKYLFSF